MAPVNSLRVLCFGDSLTSGYHSWGTSSHPYSQRLAARLKEAFPDLGKIHVVPNGVPGDRVMNAGFLERLEKAGSLLRDQEFLLRSKMIARLTCSISQWKEASMTGFSSLAARSKSSDFTYEHSFRYANTV
jgi:hypothetical protein